VSAKPSRRFEYKYEFLKNAAITLLGFCAPYSVLDKKGRFKKEVETCYSVPLLKVEFLKK